MYSHKHDGRRTASKQYVQALENRVKQLEAQLHLSHSDGTTAVTHHGPGAAVQTIRLEQHSLPPESNDGSEAVPEDTSYEAEVTEEKIGSLRVVNQSAFLDG